MKTLNKRLQTIAAKARLSLNRDVQIKMIRKYKTGIQPTASKMIKWFWIALIPSLLFAEENIILNMSRDPIYVDVQPQRVVIYPDKQEISANELDAPDNIFERFLDQVQPQRDTRYIILLLSPESASLQRKLREAIRQHGIEVGLEPWEPGKEINPSKMNQYYIPLVPAYGLRISPSEEIKFSYEYWSTRHGPCEVMVQSNTITFITNNVVVSREELDIPGNPFDRMLDQWELGDPLPNYFCKEPGGEGLYDLIMDRIIERGRKMNEWTLPGFPIEVPANDRSPVYLECISNQLFSVSADALPEVFDVSKLASFDSKSQYICFLVRPDSFDVFRKARTAAWEQHLGVSCELQEESGPLAIGTDGHLLFPERALPHNEDFEQAGPGYPPQGVGSPDP